MSKNLDKERKKIEQKLKEDSIYFDIQQNINLKNNESFFTVEGIEKTAKIIETGIGKTYNAAYLALYNLFNTNKRIIISTTKNVNVEDLIKEIRKVLINHIDFNKSEIDKDFLNSNELLNVLKIHKLTSYSGMNQDHFNDSRIIITNHSYFFTKGHSNTFSLTSQMLKESVKRNSIIIIDEVDSFEKQSFISFDLFRFIKTNIDLNGNKKKDLSNNAWCTHNKKYYESYKESLRYKLPEINYKFRYADVEISNFNIDIPLYVNDLEGDVILKKIIEENTTLENPIEDIGRREGFLIELPNGKKFNILRTALVNKIILNRETNDHPFIDLIKESNGACLTRDVIDITEKTFDLDGNPQLHFLERLDTREKLINWCRNNFKEDDNPEDEENYKNPYDIFLGKIMRECPQLYKDKILIRKKSFLDDIPCKKYFTTATPGMLKNLEYNLEYHKEKNKCSIEIIDVFFIERSRDADKFIIEKSLSLTNDNLNVLSFVASKSSLKYIEEYARKNKDKIQIESASVITSIKDKTVFGITEIEQKRYIPDENTSHKKYDKKIVISYLNGTESTGKNYFDSDVCTLNAKVEENILSRIALTPDNINVESIDMTTIGRVIQAASRIERTDEGKQKYKAVIMIGDDIGVAKKFIESKKGNGINYRLTKEKGNKHNWNKIIGAIHRRINKCNLGIEDNANIDNRVKIDIDKYEEIGNYYLSLIYDGLSKSDAKIKAMNKYNISMATMKRIIKLLN
jgi:hypothetical protein